EIDFEEVQPRRRFSGTKPRLGFQPLRIPLCHASERKKRSCYSCLPSEGGPDAAEVEKCSPPRGIFTRRRRHHLSSRQHLWWNWVGRCMGAMATWVTGGAAEGGTCARSQSW